MSLLKPFLQATFDAIVANAERLGAQGTTLAAQAKILGLAGDVLQTEWEHMSAGWSTEDRAKIIAVGVFVGIVFPPSAAASRYRENRYGDS